ncbi:hypothetical protein BGW38_009533, partial [Lunasporangiospora selenospora]
KDIPHARSKSASAFAGQGANNNDNDNDNNNNNDDDVSSSPMVGLGLDGAYASKDSSSQHLAQFVTPVTGPSFFDITSSSQSLASPSNSKKSSSGYTTRTPGRRSKRTPAHSFSSTITNGPSTPRRVSCTNTDTASQNSSSYLDEQDVELDENSFYLHLQKMQERYRAQQEPGWLRTQHAILQAKHRLPGSGSSPSYATSSHSHSAMDFKSTSGYGGSSRKPGGAAHPFFSRIQSSTSSSPTSSDYGSSPSFHTGAYSQHRPAYGSWGSSTQHRHQPVQPFNCFQPGNVVCVPRERSLGGLIFHKSFVETHILTPSPYYRGQYETLNHKVVEIDKDHVREISGKYQ